MPLTLPKAPPYTVDDLDRFPSDSNRYELIEGTLHVSAAPSRLHQRALANVFVALHDVCPPTHEVLMAPLDVVFGPATSLEPDVLVLPAGDPNMKRIEEPPLLVVEVLSPSTRIYDVGTKALVYREGGVPAMWVVDPHAPSLTEHRWADGDEAVRTALGEEPIDLDWPFPLTVVPARLIEP